MTLPRTQIKTIHLPYLHQIPIKLNHFKHNQSHLEIRLKLLRKTLINKVLLKHKPQIQYNSKQPLQQHNDMYKS